MYLKQGDEVGVCDCLGRFLHEHQCCHIAHARHELQRGRRGVGDSEGTRAENTRRHPEGKDEQTSYITASVAIVFVATSITRQGVPKTGGFRLENWKVPGRLLLFCPQATGKCVGSLVVGHVICPEIFSQPRVVGACLVGTEL